MNKKEETNVCPIAKMQQQLGRILGLIEEMMEIIAELAKKESSE